MKRLHRPDLYGWSQFDEERNLDFHSVLWVRDGGNVLIDPLPLSKHDARHLRQLGGVATIVVTNSDHERIAEALSVESGAELVAAAAERDPITFECDRYVDDGDEIVPGLVALQLHGSKTPGELALLLDGSTLITGDLIRAHAGGRLDLLPDARLTDRAAAIRSVRRLAALPGIEAVLVGDGWPVFRDGGRLLQELAERLGEPAGGAGGAAGTVSC
jgi:hypothetical protein